MDLHFTEDQPTPEEREAMVRRINSSGAGLVFIGLGCPKQERWMAAHRGKIDAVMLGLGGAFPVYAGEVGRSPEWMQKYCLEWVYRLWLEPRRLFKRYLVTNTLFLFWMLLQMLGIKLGKPTSAQVS